MVKSSKKNYAVVYIGNNPECIEDCETQTWKIKNIANVTRKNTVAITITRKGRTKLTKL